VSINKTLTLLRQVMAAAVRYGYLDRNPVEHVRRLRAPKRIKPFLQLDQVAPLVEATPEAHRPLLLTLVQAGLRIGEALALRWRDVDLLADPPRLIITRTWDPQNRIEGPVKTGEEGEVTISQRLLEVLLDHKAASAFTADSDLVFPTRTGGHQNPSNFRRRVLVPAIQRVNATLAAEGRPPIPANVTPHSLRHTFCSLLVAQGEDVAVRGGPDAPRRPVHDSARLHAGNDAPPRGRPRAPRRGAVGNGGHSASEPAPTHRDPRRPCMTRRVHDSRTVSRSVRGQQELHWVRGAPEDLRECDVTPSPKTEHRLAEPLTAPEAQERWLRNEPSGMVEFEHEGCPYLGLTPDLDPRRAIGTYFGYPSCCIEVFCQRDFADVGHTPRHPETGHVLCSACRLGAPAALCDRLSDRYGIAIWGWWDEKLELYPPGLLEFSLGGRDRDERQLMLFGAAVVLPDWLCERRALRAAF
jgi:site-specific recombinase XerC